MTRRTHDRTALGFQAALLALLVPFAPLKAAGPGEGDEVVETETEEEAPALRFGDPEVHWEAGSQETKAPGVMPEAPAPEATPVPTPQAEETADVRPVEERVRELLVAAGAKKDFSAELAEITRLGGEAVPALSRALSDSSLEWQSRWVSAMAAGRIGGEEAREALKNGLSDPLFLIRMAAVTARGNMDDSAAAADIRTALNDRALVVRTAAVDALRKFRDVESAKSLEKALFEERNFHKGRSLWIRGHIADALIEIEAENSIPVLVKLLKDTDPELRGKACDGLERLVEEKPPETKGSAESCVRRWIEWSQRSR